MKVVILIFVLYMFITVMMCGMASASNNRFIQDLAMLLWWSFPLVLVICVLIMLFLI